MPLTQLKIKEAKPKTKPYKLTDGDGLYLLVHPNGSQYWREIVNPYLTGTLFFKNKDAETS